MILKGNIRINLITMIFFALIAVSISLPIELHAFWDKTHKNTAEDAINYMETEGSNQQRWVVDYLKAKIGGRDTGGPGFDPNNGDGLQYGLIGVARAGAVAPDYCQDLWWEDSSTWGWSFNVPGYGVTNFSSWTHFMNLLKINDYDDNLKTDNYNDYDGYAYNGSYGFPNAGIDYTIAVFMNNAWMTINLPACTDCDDKYTFIPNGNPAVDYKQNGSNTPLGSPHGSKQIGYDNGTNYNCFSDTTWPNDCLDRGDTIAGNSKCQIPNTHPGDDYNFTSDQDWVIFEPLDNSATFYYNEWFLEGGNSRNSTLDTGVVSGRYYSLSASDVNYLAIVMHYAGDVNTQVHIWITTGYNHSGYEEWIDDHYGNRALGGTDPDKNVEDYQTVKAYINSRSNRIGDELDVFLTENAFLTYLARYRSGYDIMTNTDDTTRKNAATYAVNHSIASLAMLYEKGVMDLRRYR